MGSHSPPDLPVSNDNWAALKELPPEAVKLSAFESISCGKEVTNRNVYMQRKKSQAINAGIILITNAQITSV
jgi:hypothetical protein